MVESLNASYWRIIPKRGVDANLRLVQANLAEYEFVYATDMLQLYLSSSSVGSLHPIGDPRVVFLTMVTNSTLSIPAGHAIDDIFIRNTTANVVTGGLRIGTTGGASDIAAGIAVPGSAFLRVMPSSLINSGPFSPTAAQTIFIEAITAWNSASLVVVVPLKRAIP